MKSILKNWIIPGSKGFTLIELIVVIGIIAGLVAMVLPRMNNFQKYEKLGEAAEQLQSHIRMAQNNAASGVKCGANLDKRAKRWFLVIASNNTYRLEPECEDGTKTPSITYKLPSEASISAIAIKIDSTITICDNTPKDYSVAFENITAATTFNLRTGTSCALPTQNMGIVISLTADTSQTQTVIIEKGGGIYVNEVNENP